jgi:hypothetical protein
MVIGRRLITIAMLCVLTVASACGLSDAGSGVALVDPRSNEFGQRRAEALKLVTGAERSISRAARASLAPDIHQEVVCQRGNKGPKGTEDDWDSACHLQRLSVIATPDPVRALLAVDDALRPQGYSGSWRGPSDSTPIDVAAVRRGAVPAVDVRLAIYATHQLTIWLQVGRRGRPADFVIRGALGTGYFEETTGAGWDVAGIPPAPLRESVIAIGITDRMFIRTGGSASG